MKSNLHPRIIEIIELYLVEINQSKPDLIKGFYIYGSVAMGDYSLELSDIDFIAVTNERLSESDIKRFNQIHQRIEKQYKKPNFNGIYVTWNDLGRLPDEVEAYPYYMNGRMHESGYFEMNLVTWYELKHFGIRFIGPEVKELNFSVEWEQLISRMHENLNTYWKNWLKKSTDRFSFNSYLLYIRRTEIEWGVLGITRLFFTFQEHSITTKVRAGEYALKVVPKHWHKIIQESINVRQGITKSLYRSKMKRKQEAITYMNYIMEQCNNKF